MVRAMSSKQQLNRHESFKKRIAVIGGGASGIFAAIAAAEHSHTHVTVLEATSKTLQKVKISGGGRCNVLHDTSKSIPILLNGYPRGNKELNGLFHKQFTPSMARDWFEYRGGIELKTESDGRMFPTSDSSQTIIQALLDAAEEEGVELRKSQKVEKIRSVQAADLGKSPTAVAEQDNNLNSDSSSESPSKCFEIQFKTGATESFDAIILATGSSKTGYLLAQDLGHSLVSPVPSLFTLNCKHDLKPPDGLLYDLSGISVPNAKVSLSKKQAQVGPLLVTHHGLSGPAVLRLSAFAARDFADVNYRGPITIHWDTSLPTNVEELFEELWKFTMASPKRKISSGCPLPNNNIPRRLWANLVSRVGSGSGKVGGSKVVAIPQDLVWGNANKKMIRHLASQIATCRLEITGKGTFKDEFVTAGGVNLKEINMKHMASKVCNGLFLCGEVINVDGVTGGYNFMNCWSTGYVAGHGAAEYCKQ